MVPKEGHDAIAREKQNAHHDWHRQVRGVFISPPRPRQEARKRRGPTVPRQGDLSGSPGNRRGCRERGFSVSPTSPAPRQYASGCRRLGAATSGLGRARRLRQAAGNTPASHRCSRPVSDKASDHGFGLRRTCADVTELLRQVKPTFRGSHYHMVVRSGRSSHHRGSSNLIGV